MISAQLDAKQVAKIERMLLRLPKGIRNKILRQELRKGSQDASSTQQVGNASRDRKAKGDPLKCERSNGRESR
jgi:hypothetical protein